MSTELYEAIRTLKDVADGGHAELTFGEVARRLLHALPADLLAAATIEMPKEPGLYVGPGGTRGPVWRLDVESLRYDGGDPALYREGGRDTATPADGPFRRLVAEGDGPTHVFTSEELVEAWSHAAPGSFRWDVVAHFVNTYTSKEA